MPRANTGFQEADQAGCHGLANIDLLYRSGPKFLSASFTSSSTTYIEGEGQPIGYSLAPVCKMSVRFDTSPTQRRSIGSSPKLIEKRNQLKSMRYNQR